MRFVTPSILLRLVLGYFSISEGVLISEERTGMFTQPLNHSDPQAADLQFRQRYWYNTQYYKGDGPVFLETAGEWDPTRSGQTSAMCDYYAPALNAMCLLLEHRYYGESAPEAINEAENYPAGTFKYLSIDQAIEDVGRFIKWMKKRAPESNHGLVISPNSKWVVFGCSYGGVLAAWSKQRFPDLIYAAVVSSAPLEAKLDFAEFNVQLRFHEGAEDHAWQYQQCMEFGWFHVLGMNLFSDKEKEDIVREICAKYNEQVTVVSLERAIDGINRRHHGKHYFEERVIMVHGEDDVWKPAGITEPDPALQRQLLMPIIIIPHAKHCEDVKFPPDPVRVLGNMNWDYPPEADFVQMRVDIRAAQDRILQILRGWLTAKQGENA